MFDLFGLFWLLFWLLRFFNDMICVGLLFVTLLCIVLLVALFILFLL